MDKDKALDAALSQIEKAFGKGSIMRMGQDNAHVDIEAKADESMMTALERNGIAIPARCRGGECGFCNSLLVKGDVFYRPDAEYRRIGDLRFNHIHPCVTYPLSDAEIEIQLVQE